MIEESLSKQEKDLLGRTKLEIATDYHKEFLLKGSGEDLVSAINNYIDSIKDDPKEPSAYYRLAVLMYEAKQIGIEGAIEQCETAVKLAPDNPDARMYLGYFLSLKGEKQLAKKELKKAIKLSPKGKTRARLIMALELLEKKNIFNMLKGVYYMTQASLMSIFDKAAVRMFANSLLQEVNYLAYSAKGAILEKLNLDKEAYQIYMDALDNTKNAPDFYNKMAKIAVKKNRYSVALQCYENAAKLSGNEPNRLIDTIEFIQNAYPDKTDDLIDYYNALTGKLPEYARPYYELGHLYIKKNDFISASNAFRLALDHDKDNPFYLNSLAYTYVQLEQYNLAVDLYKKAIEKNPDNEWTAIVAQVLAAIYYKIQNDYDAAFSVLEYALTLTKNRTQIYTLYGDIYFDTENMASAVKYYNMSIQEGARDPKIYSRLAMAYFEEDSVQDAIDYYNLAIETDENYDVAHNNLGVIYLDSLNDPSKALSYFVNAVDINPEYMLAHFNLGRCYAKLNRKIEAAGEFQQAINLNKETGELEESEIQSKLYELFKA